MMDFNKVERILVIKLRHIGDVLLSSPVFRALKENFPHAHIGALINSGTEGVLEGNPNIDEIIVFDRGIKKENLVSKTVSEYSFLKSVRGKRFDMSVDLTSGDRAAIISLVSGARYRLAYDPGKAGFAGKKYFYSHLAQKSIDTHMVLENLGLLSGFGINTENPKVEISIPDDARSQVKDLFSSNGIRKGDTVVHIHPTSRWLFKCWRDKHMATVIDRLCGKGIKVVVTAAPEKREMAKADSILSMVTDGKGVLNLCGKTDIKKLAAVAEASDFFFGMDSAPMHIAAAVDTPVLALFGPSGAFNWGPWDNDAYEFAAPYSNRNGVQTFGRHTVIQRDFHCVPCGKDGCGGSKISDCLMDISPEEVLSVLESKGY